MRGSVFCKKTNPHGEEPTEAQASVGVSNHGHRRNSKTMTSHPDTANVVIRPPIALALAMVAGLALDWLHPLPFVPASLPRVWLGVAIFATGFALFAWAIMTIRGGGSNVETSKPTTAIVTDGPYRFTRNPIYLGMILGLIGLAVGVDTIWLLATLVVFYGVLRYGVIAREEVYLESKFGATYLAFKSRVRRWL